MHHPVPLDNLLPRYARRIFGSQLLCIAMGDLVFETSVQKGIAS
jgi:hypothetical protein